MCSKISEQSSERAQSHGNAFQRNASNESMNDQHSSNNQEESAQLSVDTNQPNGEQVEGLDYAHRDWGDYPIDDVLIRHENRTIHDVIRRIEQGHYVMDPDFQRDFIWPKYKQSKLIESVVMRIPLPVFYLAEDYEGKLIVVDGLQRLTTFWRFISNRLILDLPDRAELHRKKFRDLTPKLQNRIEDCNLIMYLIDSKVPERARLDIFERVNGGIPLSRQQMRNCLFMGQATQFLKEESRTPLFLKSTGNSLNTKSMRDREFINRFCAFQIFGPDEYQGDMDDFLAKALIKMNDMNDSELNTLSTELHNSLSNNLMVFGRHAFRKSFTESAWAGDDYHRSVLNASLWDVMSTCLSKYSESHVNSNVNSLRTSIRDLIATYKFEDSISRGTNGENQVKCRFQMARESILEVLGAHSD